MLRLIFCSVEDFEWRQLLDYAQRLGCYKGCPFPSQVEDLGRTEARFAQQLREEEEDEENEKEEASTDV